MRNTQNSLLLNQHNGDDAPQDSEGNMHITVTLPFPVRAATLPRGKAKCAGRIGYTTQNSQTTFPNAAVKYSRIMPYNWA